MKTIMDLISPQQPESMPCSAVARDLAVSTSDMASRCFESFGRQLEEAQELMQGVVFISCCNLAHS